MTSPASPSHDPARRVRLEFTVEPFVPNDPGPHVTGPIDAARRHASAVTEVGPFGTTVDAPADAIVDVVDDVVRTAAGQRRHPPQPADQHPGGKPLTTDSQPERETLDWATYGVAVRELAQMVADHGFEPDIILAIARGGLFPAGSLGYALSVKNLYVMNLEFYTGVDERLDVPVMLPPYLDKVDLTDARILVVDDVADTGHTLKVVHEFCQDVVSESMTAVLYEKPHLAS